MDARWYRMTGEEAIESLGTSMAGLRASDIPLRTSKYGKNVLPAKKRVTLIKVILHQFLSPLIYVLLAAAVVSLLLKEFADAGFIFLILLINAIVGAFQEWKAEAKASALQEMIRLEVKVKREGKTCVLDSEDLVPGDLVLLESGNRVPADIRILIQNNLMVEESVLTGESLPVAKQTKSIEQPEVPVAERNNMLFAGTTIIRGRGTGLVISTGVETEIGKIASSLKELQMGKAPLVERMEVFSKKISLYMLLACFVLGIVGYLNGISVADIFFFVVAVAVSAIPEGLPIAMTVALSTGASRMARRNVIIRRLTAVEGLGSCTYIATDKTGTLTVDQQTVKAVILPDTHVCSITGEGYNGEGIIRNRFDEDLCFNDCPQLDRLIKAVIICNEGFLERTRSGWSHAGDPVDIALLAISYKAKTSPAKILERVHKVHEVPFESERKYAMVYYEEGGILHVAVKGAIEKIKEKADSENCSGILNEAVAYAEGGYRVIAVGGGPVKEIAPGGELPQLELLGFVALIDPLRPEARKAVAACHRAGIDVAMVTGDHPATALAMAREVGIAGKVDELISGGELERILPEEDTFRGILKTKRVFSRVTPTQKQIIVQGLRKLGHFIAVTGDGVNDAPALKTANIGIAMGYGTDVAKDAASIIIRDNNFASIAAGVEEGRFTYNNLRKIIYLLISTGMSELMMIGLSLVFQLPLPFLPLQLLWLNLVTNGIQDVSLAFEAGEKGVMNNPPRKPEETIFDKQMIRQTLVSAAVISLLTFGLWYHLLNHLHWKEAAARNSILLLMVLLQNFHTLNCRSETVSIFKIPLRNNIVLVIGILAAQGIHILAMHMPFTQNLLSLCAINWNDWIKLFLTAFLILIVMELFKFINFKIRKNTV